MNAQTAQTQENNKPEMSDAERQAWAQVESVCALVASLQCDWERLEELKTKAEDGRYIVGMNMPGYMPDQAPCAFETAEDARDYLAQDMKETAERESEPDGDATAAAELIAASDELLQMQGGKDAAEYGRTVGGYHYWITFEPGKLADEDEQKELEELQAQAGEAENEEDAQRRISEDALSVEVRSAWVSPGEDMSPAEFRILLCTGGPHVEIVGDLDECGRPSSPRVLFKDWGTQGEIFGFDRESVLAYCEQYLGF